ncbi:G/U mismatch-specific DNA glycosylase [Nocardia sp. NPDC060256]|uniref:G/U mismatch-specific DNA glycosylase n=1 Tax=unclassified Nocardia TaxID=2637762 RepID=UPI0036496A27
MKDILAPELDVLFCGINPGLSSAAVGLPFATRSSRWWPALHRSGFTPRVLAAAEADQLPTWGLGLTTMVRRPTAKAAELTRAELVAGAAELTKRVHNWRPQWLAVLGVTAFRAGYGRPEATVGPQDLRIGETQVWVVPNPSGLNAHYPPQQLAEEFARLRRAAAIPDRRGEQPGNDESPPA